MDELQEKLLTVPDRIQKGVLLLTRLEILDNKKQNTELSCMMSGFLLFTFIKPNFLSDYGIQLLKFSPFVVYKEILTPSG